MIRFPIRSCFLPLLCLLLPPCVARADEPAPDAQPAPETQPAPDAQPVPAPPAIEAVEGAVPEALLDARLSLSLRQAPMQQLLLATQASTGLKFRFAALPDALITTTLSDAPLLITLAEVLAGEGFELLPDGRQAWLLRAAPAVGSVQWLSAPNVWSVWTKSSPPPRSMLAQPEVWFPGFGDPLVRRSGDMVALENLWQTAPWQIDASRSPGLSVSVESAHNGTGELWLRYPLELRGTPPGARLLIETSRPATLYFNGAPLLREFSGSRTISLRGVLQPGFNCLALHFAARPKPPADAPKPATGPLLRYEWQVDGI